MSATFQIEQMTLEEKLRAMETLWDDLCRQPEAVPIPKSGWLIDSSDPKG